MPSRRAMSAAALLVAAATAAVATAAPAAAAPSSGGAPQRAGHIGYLHRAHLTHRAAADCTADDGAGPVQLASSATPNSVSVGISETKTLVYAAELADPCGVSDAALRTLYPDGSYYDIPLAYDHDTEAGQSWTQNLELDPAYLLNSDSVPQTMQVVAFDPYGNGTRKKSAPFTVHRYAKLTANATPEPVKKGGTVTVTGTLVRADWEAAAYRGFSGEPVDLQFRTTDGSYATVGHATTGSGGAVKATTKATVNGCYRFVFAGSITTSAATSTGDCVAVH